MRYRRWLFAFVFLAILAFDCRHPSANTTSPAVIRLDPNRRFQTMEGWEATAQAGQEKTALFAQYQKQLLDEAADLGINRLRVFLKSGVENPVDHFTRCLNQGCSEAERREFQYKIINDNNDPHTINPAGFHFTELDLQIEKVVIPMRQRLAASGERLLINANYVDFGSSAFEHKKNPEEYAEFVVAVHKHMKSKYDIVPDRWEVILEPDNSGWSPGQVASAIVRAGTRLQAGGFDPKFLAPSTASMSKAPEYLDEMLQNSKVLPFLWGITYHRYKGVSPGALTDIAGRATEHHLRTAMLEKIGATYEALHQDLKLGNASAWQQFTLAFPGEPDNGGAYFVIDEKDPGKAVVRIAGRTRFLRQYFRYIRNGAVRIESTSSEAFLDPLCFINKDGRYVVVVRAASGGAFQIQGLPAGSYEILYTTGKEETRAVQSTRSGILNGQMPAKGVISVHPR